MLALMGLGGTGEAEIRVDDASSALRCGQTRLIPAERRNHVELASKGPLTVLAVWIPT